MLQASHSEVSGLGLIAREITEDEWREIEAKRAAQIIVGGEPGATYPWVELAQEVVRLRDQHAGAVEALRIIAEPTDNQRIQLSIIARDTLRAMGVSLSSEVGGQ